jgi:hypothetical protein
VAPAFGLTIDHIFNNWAHEERAVALAGPPAGRSAPAAVNQARAPVVSSAFDNAVARLALLRDRRGLRGSVIGCQRKNVTNHETFLSNPEVIGRQSEAAEGVVESNDGTIVTRGTGRNHQRQEMLFPRVCRTGGGCVYPAL